MTPTRNSSPPVAQSERLLEHCRQRTTSFADIQLAELFENAGAALLDFAERAQSNAVQGRFFEAMNQLQRHRSDVASTFRQRIQAGFTRFSDTMTAEGEDQSDHGDAQSAELSLLSPEEIEESVAAENLTRKANTAYGFELHALSERLAAITGLQRLKASLIPGGPHHLVDAYRASLAQLDVEIKAKIVLYALFDRFVIKQAGPFYEGLNDDLEKAGVLPDLKPVHVQSARHLDPGGTAASHQRAPDSNTTKQTDVDTSLGAELFNSIVELISATRRARPSARSGNGARSDVGKVSGVSPQIQAAAKETLVAALDTIQTDTALKAAATGIGGSSGIPNIEVDDGLVDRVKHVLRKERAQILQQVDGDNLAPMDGSIIDLIGMLFEYMLNDPVLPNSAKALLSHLHTPYLKLALIDQRLLVDSNHPARQLLDKMVEAGSLWVDGRNPTRGIFPAIKTVVDRIVREFKKDVSLFVELLRWFEQAMAEQQRRASTMERRTREAAQGKERLLLAKQRATRQIRILMHQHALPQTVSDFLSKTWLDDLVFVLLRDQKGENGEEWKREVETAEQLVRLFEPGIADTERAARMATVPEIRDEINLRLQRMGNYNHRTVDALLALLDDPQSWPPADAAAIDDTGESLTHRQAEAADIVEPIGSPTDTERAMIERLEKTRPGTWFEFTPSDGDRAKRVKLSWISPLTSSCTFVDKSGIQAETRTLHALAQQILSGQARIAPRRPPFIDRALVSIRRMLKRDKVGKPGTETGFLYLGAPEFEDMRPES